MMNFECVDGPMKGQRMACKTEPFEGMREPIYIYHDGKRVQECAYELRREKTVEPITGDGLWQWYFISA